jgi:hypothetical protein
MKVLHPRRQHRAADLPLVFWNQHKSNIHNGTQSNRFCLYRSMSLNRQIRRFFLIQVEAHPYLPETELLEFCKEKGIVFLAFAALGHGMKTGPLEDPVISVIVARVGKTPAQVLLAWAARHGLAYYTQDCGQREREFRHLCPSGRRARRNQSNSDQTEAE